MGAFGAAVVVLAPLLPSETSPWIFIPVMMVVGMLMGALWGFIPGVLKARFQVNEIITTLMLNYIAILWNNFWIFNKWSDAGFQMTPTFERNAWLPRLADYAREYPFFSGLTLHLGFIVGDEPRKSQVVLLPNNLESAIGAHFPSTKFQRQILEKAGILSTGEDMEESGERQEIDL